MSRLDDTTAFVTGASMGIGEEIAVTLSDYGANVALAARSEGIYETAERIDNDRALPVETDVTNETNVANSIEETVEELGGLTSSSTMQVSRARRRRSKRSRPKSGRK